MTKPAALAQNNSARPWQKLVVYLLSMRASSRRLKKLSFFWVNAFVMTLSKRWYIKSDQYLYSSRISRWGSFQIIDKFPRHRLILRGCTWPQMALQCMKKMAGMKLRSAVYTGTINVPNVSAVMLAGLIIRRFLAGIFTLRLASMAIGKLRKWCILVMVPHGYAMNTAGILAERHL